MFDVEVTEPARNDVVVLIDWFAERSIRGAENWWDAYQRSLQALHASADSFGYAPETGDFPEKLHEHFFKTRFGRTYRLVYVIRDKLVYVLRVRSTGQPLLSPDQVEFPNGD